MYIAILAKIFTARLNSGYESEPGRVEQICPMGSIPKPEQLKPLV